MGLIPLDYISERISGTFNVPKTSILGKSRKLEFLTGRHALCYVATNFGYSSVKIGKFIGRDHSTVLHSVIRAKEKMVTDDEFKRLVDKVLENLNNFYYIGSNQEERSEVFDFASELDDLGRKAIRVANRLRRQNGLPSGVRGTVESLSQEAGESEVPGIQGMDEGHKDLSSPDDTGGS